MDRTRLNELLSQLRSTSGWCGCYIGDGWVPLVTLALEGLSAYPGVEILQIKEKLGGLRLYVGAAPVEADGLIEAAERAASVTCESCGAGGVLCHNSRGWLRTLCPACQVPSYSPCQQDSE